MIISIMYKTIALYFFNNFIVSPLFVLLFLPIPRFLYYLLAYFF